MGIGRSGFGRSRGKLLQRTMAGETLRGRHRRRRFRVFVAGLARYPAGQGGVSERHCRPKRKRGFRHMTGGTAFKTHASRGNVTVGQYLATPMAGGTIARIVAVLQRCLRSDRAGQHCNHRNQDRHQSEWRRACSMNSHDPTGADLKGDPITDRPCGCSSTPVLFRCGVLTRNTAEDETIRVGTGSQA